MTFREYLAESEEKDHGYSKMSKEDLQKLLKHHEEDLKGAGSAEIKAEYKEDIMAIKKAIANLKG